MENCKMPTDHRAADMNLGNDREGDEGEIEKIIRT